MNPTSSHCLLHPPPQRKYVLVTYFSDNLSPKLYFLKNYTQKWGIKWQNECIFHTHQLLLSYIARIPPHHFYVIWICSSGLLVLIYCQFLHLYPLYPFLLLSPEGAYPICIPLYPPCLLPTNTSFLVPKYLSYTGTDFFLCSCVLSPLFLLCYPVSRFCAH